MRQLHSTGYRPSSEGGRATLADLHHALHCASIADRRVGPARWRFSRETPTLLLYAWKVLRQFWNVFASVLRMERVRVEL